MGIMDALKKVMAGGEKKAPTDTVKGPGRTLQDAGIDPSGLNYKISSEGSITVSGTVESAALRDEITFILQEMPAISSVVNEIIIGESIPEPQVLKTEAGTTGVAETGSAAESRRYTVLSGDTLWNISQEMYGNGSRYMQIFEANRELLEDPDRILPGQVLVIPVLEDE